MIVPPHSTSVSLTTQVLHGTAWNVLGVVTQKGIVFAATIIVARLLSPNDFAVAGLATAVMGVFVTLTSQGFAQALVQLEDLQKLTCHSVFWSMTVMGFAVGGLAIAAAPLLAQVYSQPALTPVTWALSLSLVFSMIGAVPNALLQREMRFREINMIGIIGGILSAGLGIGAALLGYGYWALILPTIGAAVFTAVRAFWLSGYAPAWTFHVSELKKVSTFGFSVLGSNLLLYFADTADSLIMGRFWLPTDFGQYYFALDRSRQPFDLVSAQLSKTTFPAFSRIQNDVDRLRQAFLRGTQSVCLIVFPLHILLIGLADPLLPWLFGQQWRPAVPVFQIFAAVAFVRGAGTLVPSALLAINRAQAGLVFNLFRVVVILPALVYLGLTRASVLTTAVVLLIIWVVQMPFYIGYLYRKINLSWMDSLRSLRRLIIATVVMGAGLVLTRLGTEAAGCSAWLIVAASGAVSSTVFVLLTWSPINQFVRQARALVGRS